VRRSLPGISLPPQVVVPVHVTMIRRPDHEGVLLVHSPPLDVPPSFENDTDTFVDKFDVGQIRCPALQGFLLPRISLPCFGWHGAVASGAIIIIAGSIIIVAVGGVRVIDVILLVPARGVNPDVACVEWVIGGVAARTCFVLVPQPLRWIVGGVGSVVAHLQKQWFMVCVV